MFGDINPKFKGVNNNFAFSLLGTANQITVSGTYPSYTISLPSTVTTTTFVGSLTGHASLDLPLTGGTLTNPLTISTTSNANPALALNNSNVLGTGTGITFSVQSSSQFAIQYDTINGINIFNTATGNMWLRNANVDKQVLTFNNTLDSGTGAANFAGTVTVANLIDSGLSASQPVLTNGSKQLTSGTINLASASFVSGILGGTNGGTGVNNGSSTITIGGSVTFSGASTFTGTLTGNTSVTFPTSGTLATTSQVSSNTWVDFFCISRCGGF